LAKIELRDTTIYIQDGTSGTGAVNLVSPTVGLSTFPVDTLALNTAVATTVPVGARFRITGETGTPIHTITAVTGSAPTTAITFTPVTVAGVLDNAVITFLPRRIAIKVGDGNISYTEAKEYTYELDRGSLDTVREGDDQPLALNLQFVYEFVKTGTNLVITPSDALKGVGGAAGWVSASTDACEPYAVDVIIEHVPACAGAAAQPETTTFEDFRHDSLAFDLSAATIAVTGRCNRTEATVVRV
jgi:hypothetical protein